MADANLPILVFGATGQQGGSVANALVKSGRRVRAFVRSGEQIPAGRLTGAEIARGDLADIASIHAAMEGVHGVYSAQPSSATDPSVTDEDEVRWGTAIAQIAVENGVDHLIYSSSNGVGHGPTSIGQYEAKAAIEAHIREVPIDFTIVRPAGFMETLMLPGSGLAEARFSFLVGRDQAVQLVAVEDIGKVVTAIFADSERFKGAAIEIASDTVTGSDLERELSHAAGFPITYERYSQSFLDRHPLLRQMTDLLDAGPLAGHADFSLLRTLVPHLTTFREWLGGSGRATFEAALQPSAKSRRGTSLSS